jgi:hypothetical protein
MKKHSFLKLMAIFLLLTLFTGVSCIKKLCFVSNTGTVTITNEAGKSVYMVVKAGGKTFSSGLVTAGTVKSFSEVPAGSIQIGGSLNNSTWTYLPSAFDLPACGTVVAKIYTVK